MIVSSTRSRDFQPPALALPAKKPGRARACPPLARKAAVATIGALGVLASFALKATAAPDLYGMHYLTDREKARLDRYEATMDRTLPPLLEDVCDMREDDLVHIYNFFAVGAGNLIERSAASFGVWESNLAAQYGAYIGRKCYAAVQAARDACPPV